MMSENNESDDSCISKAQENEGVVEWLDQLNLSRPKKRIHRDFSDGKLLAEIINQFYPKLVEMHNYSTRFSFATKMENWQTLNRKVLKKLRIHLDEKSIVDICNCTPGVIEKVLTELREKIKKDKEKKRLESEGDDNLSSDGSWYDVGAIDDENDVMIIPVRRRCGGDCIEVFKKKVIAYDVYESLKNELSEKNEAIEILRQKASHLENLIRTRDAHIEDLVKNMSRKSLRSRKNEISLMDTKPETLLSILAINEYTSIIDEELNKENLKSNSSHGSGESMNDLITFIDS